MKITGLLVDLLVEIDPSRYGPYVVLENGKRVYTLRYCDHCTVISLLRYFGICDSAATWKGTVLSLIRMIPVLLTKLLTESSKLLNFTLMT